MLIDNFKGMKKIIGSVLLVLLLFLTTQAQNKTVDNQFDLKGTIVEKPKGLVSIWYDNKYGERIIDSSELENGAFEFRGSIDEPTEVYIEYKPDSGKVNRLNSTSFFLEKGAMHAVLKMGHFAAAEVTGSKTQDENVILNRRLHRIDVMRGSLTKAYSYAEERKDTALEKELQKKLEQSKIARLNVYFNFINNHPDSYVSASVLNMLSGGHITLDSVKMFYNRLLPQIQQSSVGRYIKGFIKRGEAVAIGKTAPDFIQNDIQGHPVSLKNFRGKYVLLDFWASWCVPCREEDPYLVEAYKKYKDKGFTIVSVSLDTDKAKWKDAVEQDHLDWTQLSDLKGHWSPVIQEYNVVPIPDNFLIDPNGKIIARDLRGEQVLQEMGNIFKNKR